MTPKKSVGPIPKVCRLMEDYAKRGVFQGYSRQSAEGNLTVFKLVWHRNRVFDLVVDTGKKIVLIPVVLPAIPDDIYRDFKAFVASHHAADLPDHRRIEQRKVHARCANKRGNVSITMAVKDKDYAYALQRLIHLVHETYVIFLFNGMYRDYVVQQFGGDPDWV